MQVVVPSTFDQLTSRRVLTTSWLDGEKLSQSNPDDIKELVNLGVVCYLKQLLDTGFFHGDPHPGTPPPPGHLWTMSLRCLQLPAKLLLVDCKASFFSDDPPPSPPIHTYTLARMACTSSPLMTH